MISGDGEEEGGEAFYFGECFSRLPQLDEDILYEVIGQFGHLDEPADVGADPGMIVVIESGERGLVTRSYCMQKQRLFICG